MRRLQAMWAGLVLLLAGPAVAWGQDVTVRLDDFGVGNVFRPGGPVAIRVVLESTLPDFTRAFVQWEVENADGDVAEWGRSVTLTGGRPESLWLYQVLPPSGVGLDSVWSIKVFAEDDDGTRRRQLGGGRIAPADATPSAARMVPIEAGLVAAVSQSGAMGLDQLAAPAGLTAFTANEYTAVVSGVRPTDLPDRWLGLRPFEAVVWSGGVAPGLNDATEDALREYIRRGGHLVICLSPDLNYWQIGPNNQERFADLMPGGTPYVQEAVPLLELLPVMSKWHPWEVERRVGRRTIGIRTFGRLPGTDAGQSDDAGASPPPAARSPEPLVFDDPWAPLIVLPDGDVVAVQRTYGHGRVTLVGIDLDSGQLLATQTVSADVIWNRILGRRADTPSGSELMALKEADRLSSRAMSPRQEKIGSGPLVADELSHGSKANQGLVLALVLFVGYWFLAGPVGFFVLRQYKMARHAWLAFAALAGVFTAIAWGSVGLIRDNQISVRHVSVVDQIARPGGDRPEDPQLVRVTGWASVLIPGYRDTRLALASDVEGASDVISTFEPPGTTPSKFADTARYVVDLTGGPRSPRGTPADYVVPSRSTSTSIRIDYLGAPAEAFGTGLRVLPDDPIRPDPERPDQRLLGTIEHDLPGTLAHVRVIWVKSRRVRPTRYATMIDRDTDALRQLEWVQPTMSGRMLNAGTMWSAADLPSGMRVDLRDWLATQPVASTPGRRGLNLNQNITALYVEPFHDGGLAPRLGATRMLTASDRRLRLEMLSIFQMLDPPTYIKTSPRAPSPDAVQLVRDLGRTIDLSGWLARPCVIVLGFLADSEIPMPLEVAGRRPRSEGLTMVRFICPLDVDPEEVRADGRDEDAVEEEERERLDRGDPDRDASSR